jgi:Na+-driven multidrug efflux pump
MGPPAERQDSALTGLEKEASLMNRTGRNLGINSAMSLARGWDWALYGLIFLYMALPHFYRSYTVFLIGNAIPDTNALATVAQWGFVELILEVVQETFVLAIFFFVGRAVVAGGHLGRSMRTSVSIIFWVSLGFAVTLSASSGLFVQVVGTPEAIQETTVSFLRVKSAAIPITLLTVALVIMVATVNRKRLIFAMALLNILYRFISDSLFFGGYAFSLDLGAMGVAWANVASSLALLVTMLYMLKGSLLEGATSWKDFFAFHEWRLYLGISTGSGIDSLVRNLAYFFMIVRLLNLLGEDSIGGYYLAMHILWSFLLVPILALSETTKVLVAIHSFDLRRVRRLWYSSILIASTIVGVWVLLLPLWRSFATFLNPNESLVDYSIRTVSILFAPYMLLALNLVTDSVFYGIGRTRYMAYQSILTNGTIYLAAFLAYLTGAWIPTFGSILVVFTLGILVDSALTALFVLRVLAPRALIEVRT